MESGGVLGREGAQAASLIHWPMVVAVQRQEVGLPKARQIGRAITWVACDSSGTTSRNVRAELGNPCKSSTAGLDASPAVMKDNSVSPDRRSRCRVAGRISALLSSIV
jgi:hypothetical protein